MADNKFTANLKGNAGTETITNFATVGDASTALVGASVVSSGAISGTDITGTGAVSGTDVTGSAKVQAGTYVKATTHVQIGDRKYLFIGDLTTEASIVPEASSVNASIKGSLYLGPNLWHFDSDTTATKIYA